MTPQQWPVWRRVKWRIHLVIVIIWKLLALHYHRLMLRYDEFMGHLGSFDSDFQLYHFVRECALKHQVMTLSVLIPPWQVEVVSPPLESEPAIPPWEDDPPQSGS